VDVKKTVALSTLRAQLTRILLTQLADTNTSIADAAMPDNYMTGSIAGASNSSATAIITTTMSPVCLSDE
jgi:hypothetical protein